MRPCAWRPPPPSWRPRPSSSAPPQRSLAAAPWPLPSVRFATARAPPLHPLRLALRHGSRVCSPAPAEPPFRRWWAITLKPVVPAGLLGPRRHIHVLVGSVHMQLKLPVVGTFPFTCTHWGRGSRGRVWHDHGKLVTHANDFAVVSSVIRRLRALSLASACSKMTRSSFLSVACPGR